MEFNFENRTKLIQELLDKYQETSDNNLKPDFSDISSINNQEYLNKIQIAVEKTDHKINELQKNYQTNLEIIKKAIIYSINKNHWSNNGIDDYVNLVLNGNYDIILDNDNLRESIKNLCLENKNIGLELENLKTKKIEYKKLREHIFDSLNIQRINLEDEILSGMPKDLNEEEKCRYLYISLAKKTRYDAEYIITKNPDIYNKKISIDSLDSDRVICNGWAELYKQLLLIVGIPEDRIKIVGENKAYDHKYIEIYFDNYKILADATSIYAGVTDLIAVKLGANTGGFVRADLGLKLSTFEERKQYFCKQSLHDMKWTDQLDLKSNPEYKQNIYDEIRATFNSSHLYSKLFGSNCDKNIGIKMNGINEKLKKLDSFEAYEYLLYRRKTLFTEDELQNIRVALLYRLGSEAKHYEVVSCISIKNIDGSIHYYFSVEKEGLVEIDKSDIIKNNYKGYLGEEILDDHSFIKEDFQTENKHNRHI